MSMTDMFPNKLRPLENNSSSSHISSYWTAPTQPAARTDIDGHFIDGFIGDANYYIDNLWEKLRLSYSDYITRESLGKDVSGTYDVWQYNFTPENYEKTIIVTSCIHGGEIMSMLPFFRFMKEVADNWKTSPHLAYIRQKVRIISIPIANPWGVSQSTRTRQNSNGVDLNRNFDYKWDAFTTGVAWDHDYKGTAAFSEIESQYMRDLIIDNPDTTTYLDFHALGAGNTNKAYIYTPKSEDASSDKAYKNFLEWFTPDGDTYLWNYNGNPTTYNYFSNTHGVFSNNLEWCSVAWGSQALDGVEITKSTEYFGNFIILHALFKENPSTLALTEPVTHFYNFLGTTSTMLRTTSTSYVNVDELTVDVDVPVAGIIMFDGVVTVRATDVASVNYLMPSIGQTNGLFAPFQNTGDYYETYYSGGERVTLPLTGAFPVKPNTFESVAGKVQFTLKIKTTAGSLDIFRYHLKLTFIPSSRADSVKYYTATGRQGEGVGAMQLLVDGFK